MASSLAPIKRHAVSDGARSKKKCANSKHKKITKQAKKRKRKKKSSKPANKPCRYLPTSLHAYMPYMRMAMAIANVSGPLQVKKRGDGARTPWEMKTISYLLLAGFIFLLSGFVTFVLPSSAGDSGGILRKTQSPLGEKKLCMFYPNPETTFLQYQLLKVSKCHTSLPVRRAIALARTSIRPGPTRHSSPASEEQVKHGFLCSGATPRS